MDHNDREVVGPELATKIPRSHHSINAMARVISNMNVTNPIKKLVSQKRKRYIKDGFNLDLTCILFRRKSSSFLLCSLCLKRCVP